MHRHCVPRAEVVGLSDSRTGVVGLTEPGAPRTLRASSDDRQRVVDWLQAQYVAGRLDASELEERVERALAARTLADFDALLSDLPALEPDGTPSERLDGPHGRRRRRHGGAEKGFGAHATSYVLVIALLVSIWLLTTPGGYFWPVWPMLGWGIGLASHGLTTRRLTHGRAAIR